MYFRTITLTLFFLLAFAVCAVTPRAAEAHVTGSSWQVPAGQYFVDVGYDPVAFVAGFYTRFDFNLKKTASTTDVGDNIQFDEVWVRIKDANNTYLATGVRKESIGPTTLLYLFTTPGSYTLDASFRDANGNEIAAASFPITVGASASSANLYEYALYLGLLVVGALLGAAGGILFSKRRNLRKSSTI